jgi:hypothetical protein
VQDVLGLGTEGAHEYAGSGTRGNWAWRLQE